jgi:tetratricopeptide (TPR) repeat protein
VFAVSYRRLSGPAQRLFRRLALVPGADFGVELAAIAGRWFDPDTGHQGRAEPSGEVREQTCGTSCSPAAAGVWRDQESSNWLAALRHAAAAGLHHEVIRVIRALRWYADACQQYPWADIFGWGVTAAHAADDRHAEAALLNLLGWAQGYCRRDLDAGAAAHRRALAIAVETGDLEEQAWALGHLGAALVDLDRLDEALDHIERSIALFTRLGHGLALDRAHNTHGETLRRIGRYDDALAAHRAVLADVARRAGQMPPAAARAHRAHTLTLIGEIMLELRDWPQAAATFRDARALITASEQPWLAGEAAFHEGVARRRAGEADTAARCLRYALTLFADVTTRWWHARTLAELALSLDQAGAADAAREHRRDALALCEQLATGPARALAAELASQQL